MCMEKFARSVRNGSISKTVEDRAKFSINYQGH